MRELTFISSVGLRLITMAARQATIANAIKSRFHAPYIFGELAGTGQEKVNGT
jgi:hypothetical protein